MTRYDDRGMVAGYVWQKRGRTAWGAMLVGFCECPRARRCGCRRRYGAQGHVAAMTDKRIS